MSHMFSLRFISASRDYSTLEKRVPAPCLRRAFELDDTARSATVTLCGLGFYELYLNGERLTKGRLAPYISNPDDILYYDAYEVSAKLRRGKNILALMLGNGMLNCPGGEIWDFQTARYRSAPKLALSFEARLADGSDVRFEADERFVCAPSPICYDDLRVGEFYDARMEQPGWTLTDFDDSHWSPAIQVEAPRGECRLCEAEPIVITGERPPVAVRRAAIGKQPAIRPNLPVIEPQGVEAQQSGWLYDFGENTAGLCRLSIKGKAGQRIVLQFGETLDENGDLDMRAMSFLPKALNHRDIYICRGDGEESYLPFFTYHGFRYCLALGLEDAQALPETLTCVVMNSDLRTVGGFASSDDALNRLQQAVQRTDLANFYYFPTDCPQREKNGWTADAALSCEQMLLNLSAQRSLREWQRNILKAQREDGALPGVIPTAGWGFEWGNGPAWDQVLVELPYQLWRYRGDTDVIRESAAAILRYLHYITTRRDEDGLIHIGLGDWCHSAHSNHPKAPLEFTDTVVCMDVARKAAVLLDAVDMRAQRDFARAVYAEFREAARRYLIDTATMTALGGCQTTQAMAIFYDVFDASEKPEAFRVLVKMIEDNDRLMDVGVLGARVLFRVLSQFGRTDLAYELITTSRYPSYGWWLGQGATTLWESFRPSGAEPDSHNHHFWGDISGWMIQYLAGICVNPGEASPRELLIAPRIIGALSHASAYHISPYGKIESSWRREGDAVVLTVAVPAECRGRIVLEQGWQFEDGMRAKPAQTGSYRLLPAGARDRMYEPNKG